MNSTDKKYHSKEITRRFLTAMDRIIGDRSGGKVTATTFGESVTIKGSNLTRLRELSGENSVTVEAIGRMCEQYKVSAQWLITGQGNIWSSDDLFTAYQNLDQRMGDLELAVKAMQSTINGQVVKK